MLAKGIMGGTFDPVHRGHLALAEAACREFALSEVLFIPSKNPPHKQGRKISPEKDRAAMVKLAIAGKEKFSFCGMELLREGMTYTADTLCLLRQQQPEVNWHFIVGGDSLMEMAGWKRPEEILEQAVIIAAAREGADIEALRTQRERLMKHYGGKILLLSLGRVDVSSTEIRKAVREGMPISGMVPPAVADYIEKRGLYCF